jgi:SPP1 family predicted phage head-tail adaptor
MTAIGALRQRLVLQQESRVADTGGGASLSWTSVATLWAEVTPLSGKENIQGEKVSGVLTHKIRVRYHASITVSPATRFLWGARVFNIRAVRNIEERGRILEILAEEGVAT